jgi:hypothetical protein
MLALRELLHNLKDRNWDVNPVYKMDENEARRIIEGIEEVENNRKWVLCSERLPEEREWYLAVFKEFDTGFQLIPRVADYIGRGENKWRLIDEDGLSPEYRDLLECVAWMPLPTPYKAESEGKEWVMKIGL